MRISLELRESLVAYVACIDLREQRRKHKFTWLYHTGDRVEMASRLAEKIAEQMYTEGQTSLRKASTSITRNYRRLEDYAKAIGIVEYRKEWRGYGKLVEYTIYFRYRSKKKPEWDRHIEVRIYVPYPLHVMNYNGFWDTAIAMSHDSIADTYSPELADAGEYEKQGVRLMTGCDTVWCNDVCKVDLLTNIYIEMKDYRGYFYEVSVPGGWLRWREYA